MKKIFLILCLVSLYSFGQEVAPRLSPKSTIISHVGYTEIRIDYSSPGVKGRKVFGDLEQYDVLWRAGANEATKITFSTDVKINGQLLPKGSYSFFVIPEVTNDWTLIFNKDADMWGTTEYDKANDALRIIVNPDFTKESRERLIYDIQSDGVQKATVQLYWSFLKLPFTVEVDFQENITSVLQETLSKSEKGQEWKPYYDLAAFYTNSSFTNTEELNWINTAIAQLEGSESKTKDDDLAQALWIKARLLAKHQRVEEAKEIFKQLTTAKVLAPYVKKNIGNMQNIAAKWVSTPS